MQIFTNPSDEYRRGNPFWVALLSDGTYVYQRDDEEDYPGNSWLRLKSYVGEKELSVVELSVKFRDHQENMPSNKSGYFFIRSLLASAMGDDTQYFYKLGYLENGKVHITKYSVPELLEFEKESLTADSELLQECLILNVRVSP